MTGEGRRRPCGWRRPHPAHVWSDVRTAAQWGDGPMSVGTITVYGWICQGVKEK